MAVNDLIKFSLESYGGNTVNEHIYHFLGSLGFSGTLSDRLAKYEHEDRVGWQALIRGHGLPNSLGVVRQTLFSDSQQGLIFIPEPVVDGRQVLYKLSDFTDPAVAGGDPVGGGQEVSGNDNHLTQSVSADRPTYGTDGSLHWLAGDGAGDHLVIPETTFSGEFMFSIALRAESNSVQSMILGAPDTSSQKIGNNQGQWFVRLTSGGSSINAGSVDTSPHVLTVTRDASDVARLFVDGVELGSMVTAGTIDFRTLLASFNGDQYWLGDMYGFVLSDQPAFAQDVGDYLAKLAGITL